MLGDAVLDVEVARGFHVNAKVAIPENARGVVAFVTPHEPLEQACAERRFATVQLDLSVSAESVEEVAAIFADAVKAVVAYTATFDRPIGYFGVGLGGSAALVAAATHPDDVKSVVTVNAPLVPVGAHLSGVRASALFLVDDEGLQHVPDELPDLPGGSTLVERVGDDAPNLAAEWFDRTLRGVMRGARRELWRSA